MDYLVYETEAEALADETSIFSSGVTIAAALGYQFDDGIVGRSQSQSRTDAVRTSRWSIPRQRLDGKWVILHPRHHPNSADILPDGRTYELAVLSGISASVEADDGMWWSDI